MTKIKLKDLKGLLPEKKLYLINKFSYPKNIKHAYNQCIDEMAEKEIEIETCQDCRGITRFEGDKFQCRSCTGGFIVRTV